MMRPYNYQRLNGRIAFVRVTVMSMHINKRLVSSGLAILVISAISGCTYPGDSSGFHEQQKPSKQEINKYIADVENNPKMPAGMKATVIGNLKKQLADAK